MESINGEEYGNVVKIQIITDRPPVHQKYIFLLSANENCSNFHFTFSVFCYCEKRC